MEGRGGDCTLHSEPTSAMQVRYNEDGIRIETEPLVEVERRPDVGNYAGPIGTHYLNPWVGDSVSAAKRYCVTSINSLWHDHLFFILPTQRREAGCETQYGTMTHPTRTG